jgi:hypothetical protein
MHGRNLRVQKMSFMRMSCVWNSVQGASQHAQSQLCAVSMLSWKQSTCCTNYRSLQLAVLSRHAGECVVNCRSPLIANLLHHGLEDTFPGSGLQVQHIPDTFVSWLITFSFQSCMPCVYACQTLLYRLAAPNNKSYVQL